MVEAHRRSAKYQRSSFMILKAAKHFKTCYIRFWR